MKRINFLLLVVGLMGSIFVITGCTANRDGFLTSEQLLTGQEAGQTLSSGFGSAEPQLEPFDKALEESKKQINVRLVQEQEPQLEACDKALEESKKQVEVRLAQDEERMDWAFTLAKEKVNK
jgi:hypothetical protein